MKLFLLFILFSLNVHALDFKESIEQMKKKMHQLLGKETDTKVHLPMPPIPKVKKDATSTRVYKKEGRVYRQGVSFKQLSVDKKRKYWIAFLQELYQVVRGSEVKTSELQNGVNVLEQGGTREGVYHSVVLSSEYKTLEAYEEVPSDEALRWSLGYAKKYLGLVYRKDQMVKVNLWGLKRILAEKTLDIIDSFPVDGENLYRWYAHLSSDLAQNTRVSWKNKTRQIKAFEFHYRWAKKAPLQHIKSETIIKFHQLFNSFI